MKTLPDIQQQFLTGAVNLVVPEAVLVGTACAAFGLAVIAPRRLPAVVLGVLGALGAMLAAWKFGPSEVSDFLAITEGTGLSPRTAAPFDPTGVAGFVRWFALFGVVGFLLAGWREIADEIAGEYVGCVLVAAAGVSLVGRANDSVALFLSLEMISIPTYVLLYLPSRNRFGQEAAAKYFLLSILSSAILLFGFSYLYGLTGTTNIGAMAEAITVANKIDVSPLSLLAIGMILAGLAFRLAAVPFHFYAPDVYQGATGVVAQLAVLPKVAGFIALARLLGMLMPPAVQLPFDAARTYLPHALTGLAIVTMIVGNVLALLQDNLKRLLAYSGVAHSGYMLVGIVAACARPDAPTDIPTQSGVDAILVYLVAYGLMTVGFLAVIAHLAGQAESVDDLAGLGYSRPLAAALLAILLFSFIGLPPTAGFIGKFLVFVSALDTPADSGMGSLYRILVIVAAVNAAIGAVYYLRLIGVLYLRSPLRAVDRLPLSPPLVVALVCTVATIILGVYPKPLADAARQAVPLKVEQFPSK